jgi:hypothetical protein
VLLQRPFTGEPAALALTPEKPVAKRRLPTTTENAESFITAPFT